MRECSKVEENLRALRGARLRSALQESRRTARERGLKSMSMDEINAEIALTRQQRR
ncbi:MAG: hypothetical protein WED00_14490 [Aquisalimonadaceae bacterium]